MDIKKKLSEIIPPNQTQYRREFYNTSIIDALNDSEKIEVENGLIEMLFSMPDDLLIIETLLYIKSVKAIPAMQNSLEKCQNQLQRIIIASTIFQINKDNEMVDIAIHSFQKLTKKWDLVFCFSYLKRFGNDKINMMIEQYIDDPDFLISSNAKSALGLIG